MCRHPHLLADAPRCARREETHTHTHTRRHTHTHTMVTAGTIWKLRLDELLERKVDCAAAGSNWKWESIDW